MNWPGRANIVVSYAGLAYFAGKPMHHDLETLLANHAKRVRMDLGQFMEGLPDLLTARFKMNDISQLPRDVRRFEIAVSGVYERQDNGPTTFWSQISNFADFGAGASSEARAKFEMASDFPGLVEPRGSVYAGFFLGDASKVTTAQSHRVESLLSQSRPARNVRDLVVALYREFAANNRGISDDVHSVILSTTGEIVTEYHVHHPTDRWNGIDQIQFDEAGEYFIASDLTMTMGRNPDKSDGIVARPRQSKKSRCWCGSGKRYAQCHGVRD